MGRRPARRKPPGLGHFARLKDALNSSTTPENVPAARKLSKLLVAPGDAFGKKVRSALRVIDSIHHVGDQTIRRIEVVETNDRQSLGNLVYHPGTGEPLRLEISRRNEQVEFTLLHEVGHFLELAAIPRADFGHRHWKTDPLLGRILGVAHSSA